MGIHVEMILFLGPPLKAAGCHVGQIRKYNNGEEVGRLKRASIGTSLMEIDKFGG